jgi:Flp pilus assembly protein TadD
MGGRGPETDLSLFLSESIRNETALVWDIEIGRDSSIWPATCFKDRTQRTALAMLHQYPTRKFAVLAIAVIILAGCQTSPQQKYAKYMKRGQELLAKKDYRRAILEFRNAVGQAPKDAEPYYQMGLASLATGDVRGALMAFAKANELNPTDTRVQLKLAEMLTGSGRKDFVESARAKLQSLLKASPNDPEILSSLADSELLLGDADDASHNLEQALQKFPDYLKASVQLALLKLKRQDLAGAEEIFRKGAEAAPSSS